MNYKSIYNNLINKRKQNIIIKGYVEKHHIIPRCIGGTEKVHNIVKLTAREHYVCHWLLCKIYKNNQDYFKLLSAFMRMHCVGKDHQRYVNSRAYAYAKEQYSQLCHKKVKGKNNPNYGHVWIHNKELDKNKSIPKQQLEKWLQEGWIKGRFINRITITDPFGNKTFCKRQELLEKLRNGYTINIYTAQMYLINVYDPKTNEKKQILKTDLQQYKDKGFLTYQEKCESKQQKVKKSKKKTCCLTHEQLVNNILVDIEHIVASCYTLKEITEKYKLSKSVIRDAYRLKTGKGDLRSGLKRRSNNTKLYKVTCSICGKVFECRSKKALYCSYNCRKIGYKAV